jgi:hypothetical protein
MRIPPTFVRQQVFSFLFPTLLHNMKNFWLLAGLCLLSNLTWAQSDTLFLQFSPNAPDNSVIHEITVLQNGHIGLLQSGHGLAPKAYLLSSDGDILHEKVFETVADFEIESANFWWERADHQSIFMGQAQRESHLYYLIWSADSTLQNLQLVDSLRLPDGQSFAQRSLVFNPDKSLFEGFGTLSDAPGGAFLDNTYLALDPDFRIRDFRLLTGDFDRSYIYHHFWEPTSRRYLVSSFNPYEALVVDDSAHVVRTVRLGLPGSQPLQSFRFIDGYTEADGTPVGLSYLLANGPFKIALHRLAIETDTAYSAQIFPLNEPDLGIIAGEIVRRDQQGDILIAGNTISDGNVLVAKHTPNFERKWVFMFDHPGSFAVYDLEITPENEIFAAGRISNQPQQHHGFLFRISPEGTLSSSTWLPDAASVKWQIFPNPTAHQVCYSVAEQAVVSLRLWDYEGRLRWESNTPSAVTHTSHCVELSAELAAGAYRLEARFADGHVRSTNIQVLR